MTAHWLLIPLFLLTISACGGDNTNDSSSPPPTSGSPSDPVSPPTEELPEPDFEPAPNTDISPLPSPDAPILPAPPEALRLADSYDKSQLAQAIVGISASSSGDENSNNTADKAVDGDLNSRWESAWGDDISNPDDAWIQFDFGAKTAVGYMKLYWENAYADEYAIYVSDDAENWYQLRYITAGKGDTEAFYNLNVNVRYIRLQGVRRHTQYGYSLFETEFKSPGRDNSMPTLDTSYVPYPLDGSGRQPLPAPTKPIESISFTLADGTLVTRFGMVGRSRHARERGEEWNEYGFGRNETIDSQGNAIDKGPGAHLNFVANYFKNRTWGVEFIDNSNVAGVKEPRIIVNQYFQQAQKVGGTPLCAASMILMSPALAG